MAGSGLIFVLYNKDYHNNTDFVSQVPESLISGEKVATENFYLGIDIPVSLQSYITGKLFVSTGFLSTFH